jgi:hypothetical protein
MNNPQVVAQLHRIDYAKCVATKRQGDLKPCMGFAMSALPPSATMVNAVRHLVTTSLGNFSNSLSAALIHEIGRVLLVIRYR